MKQILLAFVLFALCSVLHAAKPNVILIMADDFGYECVTANGGESYQTPNLDKLAATGIRFQHCYVQPLCTPTRVQLMTGRYNVRNYVNFGTLLRREVTFGQLLQQAGYATGICGKWQLGREPDAPQHFGFQEACLWQHTRRPPRYANPGLEYNGVAKDFTHGEYGPDLVNDFALDFVARHKDTSFFLYYPMILTHDPFQPTPDSADWDPSSKSESEQRNVKHFAAMTRYMDKLIGRLLDKLEELKLRENTLLLFLGDNGTGTGVTTRFQGADYQGGKGKTTRRGMHVPLIVNWPAMIKGGRVSDDLICSTDFLPTLCEAAGARLPTELDGVSFLPQLRGENPKPRDWLYSWYSPRQKADTTVRECAFDQHYKLYRSGAFFDLATDADETQNLASTTLSASAANAKNKLQTALNRLATARPVELDRQFEQSVGQPERKRAKKKRAAN